MSSQTTARAQAALPLAIERSRFLVRPAIATRILLLSLVVAPLFHPLKAQDQNAEKRLLLKDVVDAINDQRSFDRGQVDAMAERASEAYPKNCEVPAIQPGGEALNFYAPFSATDDIGDVWCKMQTLHASKPIEISLNQNFGLQSYPNKLFVSGFAPDGKIHSGEADFIRQLVKEISRQSARGGLFWQSVQNYDSADVVPGAAHTSTPLFDGSLTMTAYGVVVSGLPFDIAVTFAPHLGPMARQTLTSKPAYLEIALAEPAAQDQNSATPGKSSERVGFPWALTSVRLSARGENVEMLARDIEGKYRKFVKPYDGSIPSEISARKNTKDNHMVTVADRSITLDITVGQECVGLAGFMPYIDINYHATSGGPLDTFTAGNVEFNEYLAKSSAPQTRAQPNLAGRDPLR